MSTGANIANIEALKQLRIALVKFAELANVALGDAESDVQRVINWVENDQATYWSHQHRKRQEALMKAKEALRHKQIFKDPTGRRQGTAEEEKAVQIAQRRMAEAEQKMAAVKRWGRQLEKEAQIYKGSVQRLGTTVTADIPVAISKLDRMSIALQGYVNLATPGEVTSTAEQPAGGASMARGEAGPPQSGDIYRALRHRSPKSESRDTIEPGEVGAWPIAISSGDQEKLAALPLERQIIDPNVTVIFAAKVWEQPRSFVHRVDPAFPGDSGWTIAPMEGQITEFKAARASDVLKAWPFFEQLIPLPPGMLIPLDSAGIAAVLDKNDNDLWLRT
jgi:uncharacterized protein with PIN domain